MSPSLLQSTLFLFIPLFSIALIVLACSHSPGPLKPQAVRAYIYIASVTLLSTLAGALPLSHSSNSVSESLIQALLFLFIGIPVLDLAPTYVPHLSIRKLHTSILVITLSIATLSALISPFLPTATPLLYISPSLFLLYTIQSIARIACILNNSLHPEDFNPAIPLALPSPASTTAFPNDIPRHHHKIPSVSTTSTITVADRNSIPLPPQQDRLHSQIVRSRSLLVFILAVQVASLAANASALGVTISAGHNNPATLKTIQAVCTVLALSGSMSAYLRHTYNLYLEQTPTTTAHSNYNNLSTHSLDQLQMIESQQHHSNSHSPMLIQLAPPPLARRKRANNQVIPIEKNLDTNAKAAGSDVELELDVVMDIGRYSMTLGRPSTTSGKNKIQDSIDLGLRLVSSPACTPVPAVLPIPLPLRVSGEEGSECGGGGGLSALEKREKEKIQEYYLSSPSTGSPSSPFSPFERGGTETDPSSPDTPYPNTRGGNPDATRDDSAIDVVGHPLLRKRSSFFGWEFAWDQEALERADDAGKLKTAGPVRRKSNLNPSKTQPLVTHHRRHHNHVVDQESFMDLPSPSLSIPDSFSAEAEVGGGGKMKRGVSWKSGACDVEKMKRKNTLGLVGMKPLRLSRSFGGTSNNSGSRGGVTGTGTGREMGHRTILSGDTGPMCGLGLKRKATALIGGQRSPVSPLAPSAAVSPRVMGQGNGDATRTIATPVPTIPKRLKKKTIPGHSNGALPSAESENGKNNQAIGFIHGGNRNLDSDNDELDEGANADADKEKDADLQKTPTIKSTRSYSQSPPSYRHSSPSSPNQQQRHQAESHCSSISENTPSTTTANTNSPQKLSPSLTRRGLSLKRSFKMGSTVGRTLGPGLTLSSAGLSCSPGSGPFPTTTSPQLSIRRCESEGLGFKEEEENCEGKEKREKNLDGKKIGKEDDEDVEAEIRSLGAAASASYARATAPVTGTYVSVDIGGGFASRSGGDGSPIKTKSKSTLHSRPSIPTINITSTTAFSLPVCSTIKQYQKQDEHSPVASGAPSKPHPFVGWFRPSQTSTTSRGDADIGSPEQEMENITWSGIDRLSSLPPLPPLQPLLLPPMTPPQSQSLPPTPTKCRSTLLGKASISNFKKGSAPPGLQPPPGSSEWTDSMSTMSGMGGGGVSMVSLAHSRSHSISKPSLQPPSRPTTPKPSMRLSAMNMGTVRNAFAGVGAKVSARMSSNSASTRGSAGIAAGNTVAPGVGMGIGMDDIDGDFMDLRDPFAPPPPSKLVSPLRGGDHTGGGSDFWVSGDGGAAVAEYDDDDSVEVGITRRMSSITGGKRRANMNAWGRLPMPSTLPLPESAPEASSGSVSLLVAKAHSHHGERRKYKKDKRARKVAAVAAAAGNGVLVERNSSLHGYNLAYNAGEEDADFGFEEALLSQRLLRRLDSVEWD